MSKQKTATSGAKVRKTLVNVLVHIFLAVLAFIWVLSDDPFRDLGIPDFLGSPDKFPR